MKKGVVIYFLLQQYEKILYQIRPELGAHDAHNPLLCILGTPIECWTLDPPTEKKIDPFEMYLYRRRCPTPKF